MLTLTAALALASTVEVKITSFGWINVQDRTAEVCGVVLGALEPTHRVEVKVDTTNPGYYVLWPTTDGKWCSVVRTFQGRAEAKIAGGSAPAAVATVGSDRN